MDTRNDQNHSNLLMKELAGSMEMIRLIGFDLAVARIQSIPVEILRLRKHFCNLFYEMTARSDAG